MDCHSHERHKRAVDVIGAAWRRYSQRVMYFCMRDIIRGAEASETPWMLKWLNFHESRLADAASGMHVRLRLGGESFPPRIFYKIYTHRPIADIGAFGPRNYANDRGQIYESEGWYERFENNGWRCVDWDWTEVEELETKTGLQDWRHFAKKTRSEAREKERERRRERWTTWSDPTIDEASSLLAWSTALDYNRYISSWHACGRSRGET